MIQRVDIKKSLSFKVTHEALLFASPFSKLVQGRWKRRLGGMKYLQNCQPFSYLHGTMWGLLDSKVVL